MTGPLLTRELVESWRAALRAGNAERECSLDLRWSTTRVELDADHWRWQGAAYPYPESCKERTIYHWTGASFAPVARYGSALIKLVPTTWGPPTFEIDGIKMLPTAQVSPYADAERKVGLIRPRGKRILDTCGGLGYFAAWCLRRGAASVLSFEKNPDVLWLRSLNPWSPRAQDVRAEGPCAAEGLQLRPGDVTEEITTLADASVAAILHDPPRIGIAGELYSRDFYAQMARVIERRGRLFHYTGTPNKLTSGRDVPNEVANRLRSVGFRTSMNGDGVLAIRE
jgi:predicted methyltransferase